MQLRLDPNRPTVDEVTPDVRNLYDGTAPCTRGSGCSGGHLHIVLDDDNVATQHVAFCLAEAVKDNCVTCSVLAGALIKMSPTQRRALARKAHWR